MAAKPVKNYTWYSGDDEFIRLVRKDKNKIPIDVTGGSAVLVVKRHTEDDTPLLTIAAVVGTTDGSIVITIPKASVTALNPDNIKTEIYEY
ncbi:MAG: hypothetical protein OEX12_08845, partial [Gammaproteobacteria bacterium]|nr:hypothetical protein [Gammaproteobacteria bacterium]